MLTCEVMDQINQCTAEWDVNYCIIFTGQSWESYFLKVIYYILLFTFCEGNALQLHIT